MRIKLTQKLIKPLTLLGLFCVNATLQAQPKFSTQFDLESHNKERVSLDSFKGRYVMVFFGFTNCPSVCPLGVSTMSKTLEALGTKASKVQALFVSVDPARDSAKHLKQFLKTFHPDILGLRGSEEELKPILKGYRAYANQLESDEKDFYLIDHSDVIYVLDSKGNFLEHFEGSSGYQKIAKFIEKHMGE